MFAQMIPTPLLMLIEELDVIDAHLNYMKPLILLKLDVIVYPDFQDQVKENVNKIFQ